jgi:PGF-CTERM protein
MKKVFGTVIVAIFMLLAAATAASAQGYGATSVPPNNSQANVTENVTGNVTENATENATNMTSVPSYAPQLNVAANTTNTTNATTPYSTSAPGFEGIFAVAGLISAAYFVLKRR